MPEYRCVILDDEPLAVDLIATHLSHFPMIQIASTFSDPLLARDYLLAHPVDLVILDIEMPDITGIELIQSLDSVPKFIFTTAYSEFAITGFELQAVDYLLKPITADRFQTAIQKVLALFALEEKAEQASVSGQPETMLIKSSHERIKLKLQDILYIEGLHKYVKITTASKTYTTLSGMAAIMEDLPPNRFFRCHRSFIVNLTHVEKVKGKIAFLGAHEVPISRGNKEELLRKLAELPD